MKKLLDGGLLIPEQETMDALVEAWNTFIDIQDIYSTEDKIAFNQGIHLLQGILARKAMARLFPDYWQ